MRPEISTLINEFERLSLDDRLSFWFTSHDELQVCVKFHRQEGRNWSVWYPISEHASKQTVSRNHLPQVLDAFGVPELAFLESIADILLTQAAYADEFVRDVGRLLGEESVRKSIRDTQHFMDELSDVFRCATGSAHAQTVPLSQKHPSEKGEHAEDIPSPPADFAAAKQRLRVIKNQN